jgi:hypothetical protein
MPNWVYNSLEIEGSKEDISAIKAQLNQPFQRQHDQWNPATQQMELQDVLYPNPVFAFWNIIAPTDLESYNKQDDFSKPIAERLQFNGDNWYDWNVRNWGTKWDVGVSHKEEYPETEIMDETDLSIAYRFNTAWSPPIPAIEELSRQYPNITMKLSYEEETGWGGEIEFNNGETITLEEYENKCRDCDEINTVEYCDTCAIDVCSECKDVTEADPEELAECEEHRELATSN